MFCIAQVGRAVPGDQAVGRARFGRRLPDPDAASVTVREHQRTAAQLAGQHTYTRGHR